MKDFDELLDGVLREDAAAEPRAGLEARVLARIEADDGLPRSSFSKYWNLRRTWLFVPTVACLGVVAVVLYVAGGNMLQPDRIATRVSTPASRISAVEASRPLEESARNNNPRISEKHLLAVNVVRKHKRVLTVSSGAEPKLETFPAVSQKGDVTGWLGGNDGGKLADVAREVTPAAAVAYQQLRAVQSEPIDIATIEIKPLQ